MLSEQIRPNRIPFRDDSIVHSLLSLFEESVRSLSLLNVMSRVIVGNVIFEGDFFP